MNTATMNKAAIGFAAFATWYALTRKNATQSTSAADSLFGIFKAQRQEVGAATGMNNVFVDGLSSGITAKKYAERQGVPTGKVDVLGHTSSYYSFNPSYALG